MNFAIEQLKALQGQQDEIALRELQNEERFIEREAALTKAQNELQQIMAGLPQGAINKDTLERVRTRHAELVDSERRKTLEVIPAWQDEKQRTAELRGMAESLTGYGLPPDYLASVHDHRLLKFIRDSWQRERRIKAALKRVTTGKPNPTTTSKQTGTPPRKATTQPKRNSARNPLEAFLTNAE